MIVAARTVRQTDGCIGEAVVLDFVERGLPAGLRQGAVERCVDLQRNPTLQLRQMRRRNLVESVELDLLNNDRLSFVDV